MREICKTQRWHKEGKGKGERQRGKAKGKAKANGKRLWAKIRPPAESRPPSIL
jgi:hypothetical protein